MDGEDALIRIFESAMCKLTDTIKTHKPVRDVDLVDRMTYRQFEILVQTECSFLQELLNAHKDIITQKENYILAKITYEKAQKEALNRLSETSVSLVEKISAAHEQSQRILQGDFTSLSIENKKAPEVSKPNETGNQPKTENPDLSTNRKPVEKAEAPVFTSSFGLQLAEMEKQKGLKLKSAISSTANFSKEPVPRESILGVPASAPKRPIMTPSSLDGSIIDIGNDTYLGGELPAINPREMRMNLDMLDEEDDDVPEGVHRTFNVLAEKIVEKNKENRPSPTYKSVLGSAIKAQQEQRRQQTQGGKKPLEEPVAEPQISRSSPVFTSIIGKKLNKNVNK